MEQQPITFTSKISYWTQYRVTRDLARRFWLTYLVWGFFVGVPLLLLVVQLCRGQSISERAAFDLPAWATLLAGLAFMGVFMPLFQMLNVFNVRRRSPSVGGVQPYTIAPDSYTVQGSLFNTNLKWDAFLKAIETSDFILLYVSTRAAHFFPKTAATPEQLHAIRGILRDRFGARAKLRAS